MSGDKNRDEPSDPDLEMVDALGNQLARLCKNQTLLGARARVETKVGASTGCMTVIEVEVHNAQSGPRITSFVHSGLEPKGKPKD